MYESCVCALPPTDLNLELESCLNPSELDTRLTARERSNLQESSVPQTELVSTIMSTVVVTVKPTDRVATALRRMVKHKIGSIIVVDEKRPVGIVTERDISTRTAKGQNVRGMIVRNLMSKPLVTVSSSAEVQEAVEQMVRRDIRRLPVVDGDKLVGMVTERDILTWMIKVAYQPNIPEDLQKLLKTRAQAHSVAH
jgi:CBS domain-containing protein